MYNTYIYMYMLYCICTVHIYVYVYMYSTYICICYMYSTYIYCTLLITVLYSIQHYVQDILQTNDKCSLCTVYSYSTVQYSMSMYSMYVQYCTVLYTASTVLYNTACSITLLYVQFAYCTVHH